MELVQEEKGANTEERILEMVKNKEEFDWKRFLHNLIKEEELDPWDINLRILSQSYLFSLKNLKEIDFDISGKLLTIAIFLLKTKVDKLVDFELQGLEEQINSLQEKGEEIIEELELEEGECEDSIISVRKEKVMKPRNPMARRRKVSIYDLIKTLENTIEQSNKRRRNILLRKAEEQEYEGPIYEKKTKDLKEIIEEIFAIITQKLEKKKKFITFSNILENSNSRVEILSKFVPMLHLHNHNRIIMSQKEHFGEICVEPYKEVVLLQQKG